VIPQSKALSVTVFQATRLCAVGPTDIGGPQPAVAEQDSPDVVADVVANHPRPADAEEVDALAAVVGIGR
jgi:hypothetical protein